MRKLVLPIATPIVIAVLSGALQILVRRLSVSSAVLAIPIWLISAAGLSLIALGYFLVQARMEVRRLFEVETKSRVYYLRDLRMAHKNPICPVCYEESHITVPLSEVGPTGYRYCPANGGHSFRVSE